MSKERKGTERRKKARTSDPGSRQLIDKSHKLIRQSLKTIAHSKKAS